eukprot:363162-Chlamydomonas_euryale.AAC.8
MRVLLEGVWGRNGWSVRFVLGEGVVTGTGAALVSAEVILQEGTAGGVVLRKASAGDVVLGKASAGDVVLGKASAGGVVLGKASAGDVVLGKASAGGVVLGKASAGGVVLGKARGEGLGGNIAAGAFGARVWMACSRLTCWSRRLRLHGLPLHVRNYSATSSVVNRCPVMEGNP